MRQVLRTNRVIVPVEDQVMRIIFALAAIAVSSALGGCFHHSQEAFVTDLPPAPVSIK
jgi:hypothetical protein